MLTRWMPLLLVLFAFASACDDVDFEEEDEITKLRTLGIRSVPAEIGPGDLAVFDALVVSADPNATFRYTWEFCPFNDGPDARYTCTQEEGEEVDYVISEDDVAFVTYEAVVDGVGGIEELCSSFDDFELPDFIEVPDCSRGLPFTIRLTIEDDSGDVEIAVREVTFLTVSEATRDDTNANPFLESVLVSQTDAEGQEVLERTELIAGEVPTLAIDPTLPLSLQALANTSEAQTFEDLVNNERQEEERERLILAWYSTRGGFDRTDTFFAEDSASGEEFQTNELKLDDNTAAEIGDEIVLYIVLRDTRGGIDFIERRFVLGSR